MGQEVSTSRFNKQDFKAFEKNLDDEMTCLAGWFANGDFSDAPLTGGFEMEAWLTDHDGRPAPVNEQFLERCNNDLIVPELAKFNVELNSAPQLLQGPALMNFHNELEQTVRCCRDVAKQMDINFLMIGILPTVRDEELTLLNMSSLERFKALNEQVLRLRKGRPLHLSIQGFEHLRTSHFDVMLESAATSFQIHLQVNPAQAARYYNAACILSAPMVAATANSPYFFGRDLWDETRIPVFEQSVSLGGYDDPLCGDVKRVSFGTDYIHQSLLETFVENKRCFPVLLPAHLEGGADPMAHVRLHNGTIWRWNRPLIGYDKDGRPHLRIEHRVVSSGPSSIDSVANAAVFYGLMRMLANDEVAPESLLSFDQVRDSFYKSARLGLRASIPWLNGQTVPMALLWCEELLPLAREGLKKLAINDDDIDEMLTIIEARVRNGRNGASWQRAFVAKNGLDMAALTAAYLEQQQSGKPVHEWPV